MRTFDLSPRLQALADQVPPGARFADIGTDHAYLPVWLILNGIIDHAIASDLRESPLERARQTAERWGVTDQISFRLADGLTKITPGEVDVLAIAGMGGETIAQILADAPWVKDRRCLLQPMSSVYDLRLWLTTHGYRIDLEFLCREGETLYTSMAVTGAAIEPYTLAELYAGRQSRGLDCPLRSAYLTEQIGKTTRALEGVKRGGLTERQAELGSLLAGLRSMKEEWDTWQR